MCNCEKQSTLVDISSDHSAFKEKLREIAVGNWVLLMQCPDCNQLWKVDEWDKYQACYAVKIASQENWEAVDEETLIKEKMIKDRGGLGQEECKWSGCNAKQVRDSAFCVDHLYAGGTRA